MPKTRKLLKKTYRRPGSTGWLTTDADEIERRRLRGINERYRVESQADGNSFFDVYRVHSNNGQTYRVEIRSLS